MTYCTCGALSRRLRGSSSLLHASNRELHIFAAIQPSARPPLRFVPAQASRRPVQPFKDHLDDEDDDSLLSVATKEATRTGISAIEQLAADLADKGYDLDADWGAVQNMGSTTAVAKASTVDLSLMPLPLIRPPKNPKYEASRREERELQRQRRRLFSRDASDYEGDYLGTGSYDSSTDGSDSEVATAAAAATEKLMSASRQLKALPPVPPSPASQFKPLPSTSPSSSPAWKERELSEGDDVDDLLRSLGSLASGEASTSSVSKPRRPNGSSPSSSRVSGGRELDRDQGSFQAAGQNRFLKDALFKEDWSRYGVDSHRTGSSDPDLDVALSQVMIELREQERQKHRQPSLRPESRSGAKAAYRDNDIDSLTSNSSHLDFLDVLKSVTGSSDLVEPSVDGQTLPAKNLHTAAVVREVEDDLEAELISLLEQMGGNSSKPTAKLNRPERITEELLPRQTQLRKSSQRGNHLNGSEGLGGVTGGQALSWMSDIEVLVSGSSTSASEEEESMQLLRMELEDGRKALPKVKVPPPRRANSLSDSNQEQLGSRSGVKTKSIKALGDREQEQLPPRPRPQNGVKTKASKALPNREQEQLPPKSKALSGVKTKITKALPDREQEQLPSKPKSRSGFKTQATKPLSNGEQEQLS